MKDREQQPSNEGDRHLDIPSESNREKHINFLEVEEDSAGSSGSDRDNQMDRDRQKEWKEGLEEGEKIRRGES